MIADLVYLAFAIALTVLVCIAAELTDELKRARTERDRFRRQRDELDTKVRDMHRFRGGRW